MEKAKLVLPNAQYKKSFLAALKEFNNDTMQQDEPQYGGIAADFTGFVKALKDRAKGKNLPKGYVPDTQFWLVMGNNYLGRVSIRHKLSPALKARGGHIGYAIRPSERNKGYGSLILKLALPKALKLGIEKALITCAVGNEYSRKIIEKNGGVLIKNDKVAEPGSLRFWVPTGKIGKSSNK